MLALFVVIFLLSSYLTYEVAVDQENGLNPYPFGSTILCYAQHALLLVAAVYYLGWIWGIGLFACHMFGLVRGSVTWVLNIPSLLINDIRTMESLVRFKIAMLAPMLIAVLVFVVVSFFKVDYRELLVYLQNNTALLTKGIIVTAILSIARIIVSKVILASEG